MADRDSQVLPTAWDLTEQARRQQGRIECEFTFEGEADILKRAMQRCKKHGPDHSQFHAVDKLTLDVLPKSCQSESMLGLVRSLANLVVRLTVMAISPNRPPCFPDGQYGPYPSHGKSGRMRRVGSGFVSKALVKEGGRCVCQACCQSSSPVRDWAAIVVKTATHVVFDHVELQETTLDFFLDSETDSENVHQVSLQPHLFNDPKLPGGSVCHVDSDTATLVCVTHDIGLARRLGADVIKCQQEVIGQRTFCLGESNPCVIVSHPHGCSKRVTVGSVSELTELKPRGASSARANKVYRLTYDAHTCPGSSGGLVLWREFCFNHAGSAGPLLSLSGRAHTIVDTDNMSSSLKMTSEEMTDMVQAEMVKADAYLLKGENLKLNLFRRNDRRDPNEPDFVIEAKGFLWMQFYLGVFQPLLEAEEEDDKQEMYLLVYQMLTKAEQVRNELYKIISDSDLEADGKTNLHTWADSLVSLLQHRYHHLRTQLLEAIAGSEDGENWVLLVRGLAEETQQIGQVTEVSLGAQEGTEPAIACTIGQLVPGTVSASVLSHGFRHKAAVQRAIHVAPTASDVSKQ